MLKLINTLVSAHFPTKVTAVKTAQSEYTFETGNNTKLNIRRMGAVVYVDLVVDKEVACSNIIHLEGSQDKIRTSTISTIRGMLDVCCKRITWADYDDLLGDMAKIEPRFHHFTAQATNCCYAAGVLIPCEQVMLMLWTCHNMHYKACPMMRLKKVSASPLIVMEVTVLAECPLTFVNTGSAYYFDDNAWNLDAFHGDDFDEIYTPEQFAAQEEFCTPDLAEAIHQDRYLKATGYSEGFDTVVNHNLHIGV